MERYVTFHGKQLSLVGRRLEPGMPAPDFHVTATDATDVTLSSFADRIKMITTFVSLDTSLCDLQIKEFNRRAASLSEEVVILGVSKDLPFAQQRFCVGNDITAVKLLSDYKTGSFGVNFGLLIKEINLLARAVIILDRDNVVRYVQVVPETSEPPDYETAFRRLAEVAREPVSGAHPQSLHCVPCEGGVAPLSAAEIAGRLRAGWVVVDGTKIVREFMFPDFGAAKYFLDLVSICAAEQGHHPTMTLMYNKVKITLATHAAGGLTENDFIMALIIDELSEGTA